MLLIISLVLAVLPLLGVGWILAMGTISTVDGLFTSLILLTMSAIFGFNAWIEFPRARRAAAIRAKTGSVPPGQTSFGGGVFGSAIRGIVQSVQFFEAPVGQPNKSLIVIANGQGALQTLVLEGDLRNRLPTGKKMELVLREDSGRRMLVEAEPA